MPQYDDESLFEMLILEGAQAGLSWITILRKRAAYRAAFDQFDPRAIAAFDRRKVRSLMGDSGIVRNRAKIEAAIGNARAFLRGSAKNSAASTPTCGVLSTAGRSGTPGGP